MKTLTSYCYGIAPIVDDMTQATNNFVAMAIALGLIADPDFKHKLKGFTSAETKEIEANVSQRLARMIPTNFEEDTTHFLGDYVSDFAI